MVSWVGVGASLISALLFFGAARCLAHEKDKDHSNKMQYLMPGKADTHLNAVSRGYLAGC